VRIGGLLIVTGVVVTGVVVTGVIIVVPVAMMPVAMMLTGGRITFDCPVGNELSRWRRRSY
jgi:hypothetical protein